MATRTILIVENDTATGELLRAELKAIRGWVVGIAPDAATARRLLGEHRFDILVIDVDLPDLGGRELLSVLRSTRGWHEPPVILMSGHEDRAGVHAATAHRAVARVLTKPLATDVLIAVIRDALA